MGGHIFYICQYFLYRIQNLVKRQMSAKETKETTSANINSVQHLDRFFEGKQQLVFWMSIILTFILALVLFEPKVSVAGDDSMYINRAYNFITKGVFPVFQGPLYPMIIGVLISIVGVNLIALKIFSLLCLLIHQGFTFKLFRNYLSPFTLFVFMLLISSSSAFIYYGSATYNETFYLCLQSIFLYYFEKSFIRNTDVSLDIKRDFSKIVLIGLLLFLLSIAKNIGLVALIGTIIYLLLNKSWKLVTLIIGFFAIFMISFSVIKSSVWEIKEAQISSQGSSILLKHPYQPDLGKEDAYGYWLRLIENSKSYLGYQFLNIFGISKKDNIDGSTFATLVIYALFITGFFAFFKNSKFWLFMGVFISVSFGATFLALQTYWNQERLIIVFTPILLTYLLYVLYYLFANRFVKYGIVFIAVVAIIITANFYKLLTKIPEQTEVISKYFAGDKYYGFPIDWVNYLNMTKWVNDNLPHEAYIACRKPGMAFIYSGGKDFYGIWKVTSDDPEELYSKLKDNGVTHVIMANIRANPDDPNSRIINTVRRYLSAVNKDYPGKLKLVHQIGENYPAYLYKLD